MSVELNSSCPQSNSPNYMYPEFVIDEQSGQVKVNLIDKASGCVVRRIASTELTRIVQGHTLISKRNQ